MADESQLSNIKGDSMKKVKSIFRVVKRFVLRTVETIVSIVRSTTDKRAIVKVKRAAAKASRDVIKAKAYAGKTQDAATAANLKATKASTAFSKAKIVSAEARDFANKFIVELEVENTFKSKINEAEVTLEESKELNEEIKEMQLAGKKVGVRLMRSAIENPKQAIKELSDLKMEKAEAISKVKIEIDEVIAQKNTPVFKRIIRSVVSSVTFVGQTIGQTITDKEPAPAYARA